MFKTKNGLLEINNAVLVAENRVNWGKAVDYATEFDPDLKHIKCTNWFNRVCHEASMHWGELHISREVIKYKNAPIATSLYKITCSADGHKSEFWMQGHPFPKSDKSPRGKDFVMWCRNIVEEYNRQDLIPQYCN